MSNASPILKLANSQGRPVRPLSDYARHTDVTEAIVKIALRLDAHFGIVVREADKTAVGIALYESLRNRLSSSSLIL